MLVDKTLSGSIASLKMIKMTEPGIKHAGPGPALSLSDLYLRELSHSLTFIFFFSKTV